MRRALVAYACLAAGCNVLWGVTRLDFRETTGQGGSGGTSLSGVPSAAEGSGGCVPVPAIPTDWLGPMALYSGSGKPMDCDAGWTQTADGGFGFEQDPTPCACGCKLPPEPCGGPSALIYYTDPGCSGQATNQNVSTTCALVATPNMLTSIHVDGVPLGMCKAEQKPPPAASWSTYGRVCAHAPGTCLYPPPGYNHPSCIMHAGTVPCPDGPYATVRTLFGKLTDTRTCAPCSCGSIKGMDCASSTVAFYSDSNCKMSLNKSVPADGNCHDVNIMMANAVRVTPPPTAGSCDPSGGAIMSGQITSEDPTTVCCTD